MTRLLALGLGALALAGLLAGCTAPSGSDPSASGPSASSPASRRAVVPATASPSPDALRARFDAVAKEVIADGSPPTGRAFAAALTRAGFPAGSVEVTADRTAVGLPVPSVQFSVRAGERCVIGQFGPGAAYGSVTVSAVDGRCLIGDATGTG